MVLIRILLRFVIFIGTLVVFALAAQLAVYTSSHEWARILSGSSITFTGGNHMILLNVLQRDIFSLKSSNDPSYLDFVEGVLQFYSLHLVSTSSSGTNIRRSRMPPTFLPMLEDSDLAHLHPELLQHVSSLRGIGVDITIEIINMIASFGDGNATGSSGKANEGSAVETDSKDKVNENHCFLLGSKDSVAEAIIGEQFVQLCIFHLMVLVHRTVENA
ncbi:hypothetical protein KIW84_066248 [Lathyrus oleraceus]|uniref:Uncharacterized protein n=1 Tax=Pisum sativum TaxID=3888 RepID=A0A9D5ABB9_PEA|nr:hypothetical protein KIW84_066248 [Pisum sativum]